VTAAENKEGQARQMTIEPGALVILHPDGPAGGFPMVIAVDHIEDGLHWFLGSCDPIQRGERLIVESPVPDDARYATKATVMASSKETFALKIQPSWHRVQQREFVRISAHGLQVRVVRSESGYPPITDRPDPGDDPRNTSDTVHDLLDVSAGGIRFQADGDWEPGDEMICHFELPGSLCFVLAARVARLPRPPNFRRNKPTVAVEFVGIDETTRSQLLRWVYREQVRRHKIADLDER
jgi:c-di-GMP-binding flagellar brake protein YcgR